MSYQVLARKYRPQQLTDVIAQEHITRTLTNAIKSDRLSSGYLFTGPRGTGKTTTARILAKAINCAEGEPGIPCDKCTTCKEIISGSSLDVLEIDAASNTGVDDMRTLRENVRYLPTSGQKRIYIIDEVHRLSGSAFDALLKTLEEPPDHVVFMLATTEPHKVPETIRSRTQRYDFHRVSVSQLKDHINKIAKSEKIKVDDEALFLLARKADGSVRDSLSLLDQLFAFADDNITAVEVNDALGLIDSQFYFEYVRAVAAKDSAETLEMVNRLIDSGVEIPEFCSGLVGHFRNLLILQNAKQPEKLVELSESEFENFEKQRDFFQTGDLLRMIKIVTDLTFEMKSGIDPRLLLETTSLKLASMESTVMFEDILAHLSGASSEGLSQENPALPASGSDLFGKKVTSSQATPPQEASPHTFAPVKAALQPQPEPKPFVPSESGRVVNLPMIQTSWSKFTDYFKTKNRMLAAHLSMVEIREVKDNTITAVFYNGGGTSKQVVEKKDYLAIIITELREYYKANLKIKFVIDPSDNPKTTSKTVQRTGDVDMDKLLKEDKNLKNLVDQIDGEIIGIKDAENNDK
ncbi:MAG: DNA polymerase III subunit gamma/tau [candidate division Zixibacteria bacterium]|nr:DNA polymerase III subunit gamma/tau [candidate division Zixibacteria bacterium]